MCFLRTHAAVVPFGDPSHSFCSLVEVLMVEAAAAALVTSHHWTTVEVLSHTMTKTQANTLKAKDMNGEEHRPPELK